LSKTLSILRQNRLVRETAEAGEDNRSKLKKSKSFQEVVAKGSRFG